VPRAVLGLGGNLGARRALLVCARALLESQPGLTILAASRLFHTPPLGPPQPEYLNAALLVDWVGSPRALLCVTQHIEQLLRRRRGERWGARTLDIDILFWSAGPVREPGLTIPHPELGRRAFALVPLLEVAPELESTLGLGAHLELDFARTELFAAPIGRLPDGNLRLGPAHEASELGSAFVAALSCRLGPGPAARSTLPFVCPAVETHAEAPWDLLGALHARWSAALEHGFWVRNAAITDVGQGRCEGVFVGAHVGVPVPHAVLTWVLEPAPEALPSDPGAASKPSWTLRIVALS
jgi:2-amino-4-hydroxy-6-hydroxymethyldihydropteridine diphosphokinase